MTLFILRSITEFREKVTSFTHIVTISRAKFTVDYPASLIVVFLNVVDNQFIINRLRSKNHKYFHLELLRYSLVKKQTNKL